MQKQQTPFKSKLPMTAQGILTLTHFPELKLSGASGNIKSAHLIRLDEINAEGHQAYRQALANVYATLDPNQAARLVYLLDSSHTGVSLYFGMVADTELDSHEAMKNLRGALEGQLPGVNFGKELSESDASQLKADSNALLNRLNESKYQGLMLGAPTGQETDQADAEVSFQGIDRLVRSLHACEWQLAVISQPISRQHIREKLDDAFTLSSQLAALVRTSVQHGQNSSDQLTKSSNTNVSKSLNDGESTTRGKNDGGSTTKTQGSSTNQGSNSSSNSSGSGENTSNSDAKSWGTNESKTINTGASFSRSEGISDSHAKTTGGSIGVTQEIANKQAQHLMDYLDKQLIVRLQKGLTKGLFQTAVYLTANDRSTYNRLKNTARATFQGSETTMSPLEIYDLDKKAQGKLLHFPALDAGNFNHNDLLFHSLYAGKNHSFGSLITADELSLIASLPQHELQGVRRRKAVEFIVDLPDADRNASLDLGAVIDHGRQYSSNRVYLERKDLNKHVFVTGVTGAGKTTTCLNLLLESELPFLVIEPAKTEYRELNQHLTGVSFYRPNGDDYQSLRINPFALIRKEQRIKSHAGFLKNVFTTIFPMEASMPMMVESAILAAYEEKGWDIDENTFLDEGDPFAPETRAWPTMSDMIRQLDLLIPTYNMGKEFEEKYRGSLVSRLRSLTDGTLGRVLDVPQSIDFIQLLKQRAVIELEELQGGEEKALMMALLLGGLNEAIRSIYATNPEFRHLTLIEEAHRLLSRPSSGDNAASMAVEAFADMLAEVRKYGAGIIIADQIPAKLIPDVIKNTHTKIVHRLFAEDDRRAMGEAMMMTEEQRNFLPNLATGEAVIFCGGWHGPAHTAIRHDLAQTNNHSQLNLEECGIKQLWQEKKRYYPNFCQLNWLTLEQGAPALFAQFIREAQQAQNQFLRFINAGGKQKKRTEQNFKYLKDWIEYWQTHANQQQSVFQSLTSELDWPESLLAAAWLALLLDANPRAQAQEKNVIAISDNSRSFLISTSETIIKLLLKSNSSADFYEHIKQTRDKDLPHFFANLKKYKAI